ncbi:hypothetical protein TBR22_A51990 [Luteitalea sp. TBR-22]|nr:hypothetical protein TBR22_A51990 [Luteitalea sp. TBR-22]
MPERMERHGFAALIDPVEGQCRVEPAPRQFIQEEVWVGGTACWEWLQEWANKPAKDVSKNRPIADLCRCSRKVLGPHEARCPRVVQANIIPINPEAIPNSCQVLRRSILCSKVKSAQ